MARRLRKAERRPRVDLRVLDRLALDLRPEPVVPEQEIRTEDRFANANRSRRKLLQRVQREGLVIQPATLRRLETPFGMRDRRADVTTFLATAKDIVDAAQRRQCTARFVATLVTEAPNASDDRLVALAEEALKHWTVLLGYFRSRKPEKLRRELELPNRLVQALAAKKLAGHLSQSSAAG